MPGSTRMGNWVFSLLDAVRMAKQAEQKAEAFYTRAARRIVNPIGYRLFKQLAEFEHLHHERLVALERSVAEQGVFSEDEDSQRMVPALSEAESVPETMPKGATDILKMALEIERRAKARYADLAERTEDPDGRSMFRRLEAEEDQHYRTLENALRSLTPRGVWDWSAGAAQTQAGRR